MPIDTYSVVIFTGQPKPEPVKAVGPFPSRDDAEAWIEQRATTRSPGQVSGQSSFRPRLHLGAPKV